MSTFVGRRRVALGAFAAVVAVGAVSLGVTSGAGAASVDAKTATTAAKGTPAQIVDIEMTAIAFEPRVVNVKAGKLVRFRFHNASTVAHEALIGDDKVQAAHEKMRKALGDKPMAHAPSSGYVLVQPGKTGTLDYTFRRAGRTLIGCHQPGHWPSGMRIVVAIEPATSLG